jgi:hypothetical protein
VPAQAAPSEEAQARLSSPAAGSPAATGTDLKSVPIPNLGELLRELEIRPALSGRRLMPGASEQWTEIPITSRVFLSVRGLSADDAPLADSVARELKKLLRTR